MADSEWYEVPGLVPQYPNMEAASVEAERVANDSDREVEVYRCTRTLVRRYTRKVTLSVEDVSTAT